MTLYTTGERTDRRRAVRQLVAFFCMTFAITWGLGALLLFAKPTLEAALGPMGDINHHWLFYVAVYAPTISAVTLSLVFGGWDGLRALALQLLRPMRLRWMLAAAFTWPAAFAVGELAMWALGVGAGVDLHALGVGAPVLALTTWALVSDPGGLGEEMGWRGFALPRLHTLCRPLSAAILLGLIIGVWHLPAFFVSDLSQSKFDFGWFILGNVSMTVFMSWIFVNANGNVLVAGIVPHLTLNLLFDAHVFRGDVGFRLESIVLTLVAAALVAIFSPNLRGWPRQASPPFVRAA